MVSAPIEEQQPYDPCVVFFRRKKLQAIDGEGMTKGGGGIWGLNFLNDLMILQPSFRVFFVLFCYRTTSTATDQLEREGEKKDTIKRGMHPFEPQTEGPLGFTQHTRKWTAKDRERKKAPRVGGGRKKKLVRGKKRKKKAVPVFNWAL